MIKDQNQNINFLPPDIEAKARTGKGESSTQAEYTEPEKTASAISRAGQEKNGEALNFLTRRSQPPLAAPSSFGPGSTQAPAEPSAPSLMSATEKPVATVSGGSEGPKPEPLASVPSEAKATDAPANGEPENTDVKQAPEVKEPRRSWWARLFSRPKKKESVAPPAEISALEPARPEQLPAAPTAEALGVNLLSAEYAQAFVLKNRVAVAAWTAVVSVLALAVGYTGALVYQSRKMELLEAARSRNQAVSSVIVTYRDLANEDELLRRKILALKFLLKKHISLKTFLEKLEAVTVSEVTYLNIAVTAEGGVNMAARASDYTAAARQLAIFKTEVPWLKEVVMNGARRTAMAESKEPSVSFDLALKVDESVFMSSGK